MAPDSGFPRTVSIHFDLLRVLASLINAHNREHAVVRLMAIRVFEFILCFGGKLFASDEVSRITITDDVCKQLFQVNFSRCSRFFAVFAFFRVCTYICAFVRVFIPTLSFRLIAHEKRKCKCDIKRASIVLDDIPDIQGTNEGAAWIIHDLPDRVSGAAEFWCRWRADCLIQE